MSCLVARLAKLVAGLGCREEDEVGDIYDAENPREVTVEAHIQSGRRSFHRKWRLAKTLVLGVSVGKSGRSRGGHLIWYLFPLLCLRGNEDRWRDHSRATGASQLRC